MTRSALILLVILVLYWLALSGYFDHMVLFVTGGISVALVVALVARMKILDAETVPYVHGKALGYFPWLFREIIKANFAVVKAVLSPDMEISPSLIEIDMEQESDLGRTVFANSITLTPGTVSIVLDEKKILVHALLDEMTDPEGFQEMGRRSGWAVSDGMVDMLAGKEG